MHTYATLVETSYMVVQLPHQCQSLGAQSMASCSQFNSHTSSRRRFKSELSDHLHYYKLIVVSFILKLKYYVIEFNNLAYSTTKVIDTVGLLNLQSSVTIYLEKLVLLLCSIYYSVKFSE